MAFVLPDLVVQVGACRAPRGPGHRDGVVSHHALSYLDEVLPVVRVGGAEPVAVLDHHDVAAVPPPPGKCYDPVRGRPDLRPGGKGNVHPGVQLPLARLRVLPVPVARGDASLRRPSEGGRPGAARARVSGMSFFAFREKSFLTSRSACFRECMVDFSSWNWVVTYESR